MLNDSRSHFFGQPLEVANPAQIEWVEKATKSFIEKLREGEKLEATFSEVIEPTDLDEDDEGQPDEYSYKVCIESYCFLPNCGHQFDEYDYITISVKGDEQEAIDSFVMKNDKTEYTCPRCGSKYHVDEGGYFKMFFPKMRGYEHFLKEAGIEDGE